MTYTSKPAVALDPYVTVIDTSVAVFPLLLMALLVVAFPEFETLLELIDVAVNEPGQAGLIELMVD